MESRPTTNDTRRSPMNRVGGACFVCRAKKRKCSGRKPRCDQCKSSDLHCVWPKQQKRGIPKNFIRKLESRLWRTETLLKSILPLVPDEQLEVLLRGMELPAAAEDIQDKESFDPKLWELYPLTTLENVREWQTLTISQGPDGEPTGQNAGRDSFSEDMDTGSPSGSESHHQNSLHKSQAPAGQRILAQNHTNEAEMILQPGSSQDAGQHVEDMEQGDPSAQADGFLPETFQRQFLW